MQEGGIKNKFVIAGIEERFTKIQHIGEEEDDSESVTEGIEKALRKEFRQTIPTGIGAIDSLTGGGLGKGEIGVILAPSGVGKTTALTIIANTAFEQEKNVAHIVFEDSKDDIKRKHYVICLIPRNGQHQNCFLDRYILPPTLHYPRGHTLL